MSAKSMYYAEQFKRQIVELRKRRRTGLFCQGTFFIVKKIFTYYFISILIFAIANAIIDVLEVYAA